MSPVSGAIKSVSKAKSYQNFNIVNSPLSPLTVKVPNGVSGGGPKNYLPEYTHTSQSHVSKYCVHGSLSYPYLKIHESD